MEQNIGFIGVGNMASAIIHSILNNTLAKPEQIFLLERMAGKVSGFVEQGMAECADTAYLVENSQIIFLAVKPQNFETVLKDISHTNYKGKTFVSIAAGISIATICNALGAQTPVIRVMPNTPLMVGCGASALSRNHYVTPEIFKAVEQIFAVAGYAAEIDESLMNEVVSVNGSSPAYVYLFAQAIAQHAKDMGLDEQTSLQLIAYTLIGSAKMLLESGETPDELIKKVSSPGGTTLQALDVLYKRHFSDILTEAMDACTRRSYELSQEK